jgi:hypothetical protein
MIHGIDVQKKLNKALFGAIAIVFLLFAVAFSGASDSTLVPGAGDTGTDWALVEQVMGRNGTLMPGDVMKFSMPRSDLKVMVGNVTVAPGLALGSWTAFKKSGDRAMAMGDLVLLESEVGPVMDRLERGGMEITALHNHLAGESPRIMYMHIGGQGDPVSMARTIHEALALTGTPAKAQPAAKGEQATLDTTQMDRVLGHEGKWSGNVYQYSVPRADGV